MKVGILGAGPVGCGAAAYLEANGHEPAVWSPSGKRTAGLAAGKPTIVRGEIEGSFHPRVAASASEAVRGADAVLVAVPGNAHKKVMDAIAPYIAADQTILISSHHSFSALYISRLLAARGLVVPVVAWGTTLTTGQQHAPGEVDVSTVRNKIDAATVPEHLHSRGMEVCRALFGDRFVVRDGLLAIALSNVNPQNHMALALTNLTRIERGEDWQQFLCYTPSVGRLVEALDGERLAIAEACGVKVRTVFEHLHLSYHVPVDTVSNMILAIHRQGRGGGGPKSLATRYVTEDCPFGLVVTVRLGRMVGRPALLHEAGIRLFSALYGRDFEAENDLLDAIGFASMTLENIKHVSRTGYGSREAERLRETG
jgi:opine dehydrogenase